MNFFKFANFKQKKRYYVIFSFQRTNTGIWQKTFGGLDRAYYLRHLFFALILAAIFVYIQMGSYERILNDSNATETMKDNIFTANLAMYAYIAVSTLLYPYARFVYESVVNFIMGENVFFINAIILLFWKFFVMITLFCFAIFIAPIGLLYLWYYHNKNGTFDEISDEIHENRENS